MSMNDNDLMDFDFEEDDFDTLELEEEVKTEKQVKLEKDIKNVESNIKDIEEKIQQKQYETEDDNDNSVSNSEYKIEKDNEKEYILYVVTDRLTSNLLGYFRNAGLPVSKVFNSIQDARDKLLMQTEPCRLVIIETGLGKFTSVNQRKELVDMLGISDEDNNIAIFYTDSLIKSDAKDSIEINYKDMDWFKYKSTADTVARILLLKEKYVLANNYDKISEDNEEDILNSVALPVETKAMKFEMGKSFIDLEDMIKKVDEDGESIIAYKIKY